MGRIGNSPASPPSPARLSTEGVAGILTGAIKP
jgi:hypothetical protein